jgi:hypothetical protein
MTGNEVNVSPDGFSNQMQSVKFVAFRGQGLGGSSEIDGKIDDHAGFGFGLEKKDIREKTRQSFPLLGVK